MTETDQCTDKTCMREATYALWMGEQFSRVADAHPSHSYDDGDLHPHVCEDCLPRYRDLHGDKGEFIRPEEKLVTDSGTCSSGIDQSGTHVALVSGGLDSTGAARVAVEEHSVDLLAYLDTGTGLDENREYIERLADHLGVQLWTLRTHESYEKKVQEHGFPGPSRHTMMYSSLKERQIGKLATVCNGYGNSSNLHLWTGVRSDESERRMAHVERVQEADRWTWVAPIHDWSKAEVREYIEKYDLPKNPLWDTLGRSGDCFCGCFGAPEEKLDLCAAGCEDHAEWIEDLETSVDTGDETERWAWGALSEKEQRGAAAEADDGQMFLCSSCEDFVARTDGGNRRDVGTGTDRSEGGESRD